MEAAGLGNSKSLITLLILQVIWNEHYLVCKDTIGFGGQVKERISIVWYAHLNHCT